MWPNGQTPLTTTPLGFVGSPHRALDMVEEYDPATNTWRSRMTMPTPRNHLAGGAVNGKIYAIGGRTGSVFAGSSNNLDLVEVYDPATDMWGAPLARMPTARSGGGWGVHGGQIYVAGGELQTGSVLAAFRVFEAYDPANNSWATLPNMPRPHHGVAAAFIGNRFDMVAGDTQSSTPGTPMNATAAHDVFEVTDPKK